MNSGHVHSLTHMFIQQIVMDITFRLETVHLQKKKSIFHGPRPQGAYSLADEPGQLQEQLSYTAVCGNKHRIGTACYRISGVENTD